MAVSCFPTPAVFDWPNGFIVVNQQQMDDVTVFDLSVPVTDVLVYSLIGKNGNIGQLSTEYIINVKPAGALLFQPLRISDYNLQNKVTCEKVNIIRPAMVDRFLSYQLSTKCYLLSTSDRWW